jgi:hypothetical protein
MLLFIKYLATIPLLLIFFQIYAYSSNSKGEDKQSRCQKLGIAYMAIGITALIARDTAFAFVGLVLIMFGFRLIARGLDRLDKKIFIDRYDGDPKDK